MDHQSSGSGFDHPVRQTVKVTKAEMKVYIETLNKLLRWVDRNRRLRLVYHKNQSYVEVFDLTNGVVTRILSQESVVTVYEKSQKMIQEVFGKVS